MLGKERETGSSLLTSNLKEDKLLHSGKEEDGKTFHKLHVLGKNGNLWDRVHGLSSASGLKELKLCGIFIKKK